MSVLLRGGETLSREEETHGESVGRGGGRRRALLPSAQEEEKVEEVEEVEKIENQVGVGADVAGQEAADARLSEDHEGTAPGCFGGANGYEHLPVAGRHVRA